MHRTPGVAEAAFSHLRADAIVQGSAPAACVMIGKNDMPLFMPAIRFFGRV